MRVNLKKRPAKNGMVKLYLETYFGYHKDPETGKIKHSRKKEAISFELYEKPKNRDQKEKNTQVMDLAEKMRAEKYLSLSKKNAGVYDTNLLKSNFFDYAVKKIETSITSNNNIGGLNSALKQFKKYTFKEKGRERLNFEEITTQYLEGFQHYLKKEATHRKGKLVKHNTALAYWRKIAGFIQNAVKDGIIEIDPTLKVKPIKAQGVIKYKLTFEDVTALTNTEIDDGQIKDVFLFSCYTGLRFGDIQKLKYKDIIEVKPNEYIIRIQQNKSVKVVEIPVEEALKIIGLPNKDNYLDHLFEGLHYNSHKLSLIRDWCIDAGIYQKVTWHTARHFFGDYIYFKTGDIMLVADLMGDTIETVTRNYVKKVDSEKKRDAIRNVKF